MNRLNREKNLRNLLSEKQTETGSPFLYLFTCSLTEMFICKLKKIWIYFICV